MIEEEIEKLRVDGPTEEELDKAKKYPHRPYALRFDTSTKIAGTVALQTEGLPVEFLDQRNELIAAPTLDDLAAHRLFDDRKRSSPSRPPHGAVEGAPTPGERHHEEALKR